MTHRPLPQLWSELANVIRELRHHPEMVSRQRLMCDRAGQLLESAERCSSLLFQINVESKQKRAA